MKYEEYVKQYGEVEFKGKKYALTENAYCDNYKDGIRYFARAIDKDGNEYEVHWETTYQWDLSNEYDKLENIWSDGSANAAMDKASEALAEADYHNPADVEALIMAMEAIKAALKCEPDPDERERIKARLEEVEAEIEKIGRVCTTDESNACNWYKPVEVEQI